MKKTIRIIYIITATLIINSCADLELTPKTGISTENFFRNLPELEMGLNSLYEKKLWKIDQDWWTDDMFHRGGGFVANPISTANINSESELTGVYWTDLYDGIKRANTILQATEDLRGIETESDLDRIEGEARAIRAYFYGVLVTKFGDVPLLTLNIPLAEAYDVTRTEVEEVKKFIFSELDLAASLLPINNENRANRGFALGIKARIALYLNDFQTAKVASKAVIDLGIYELDRNFRTLFLKQGAASKENIIFIPQSIEFNVNFDNSLTRDFIPRNAGGYGAVFPTFEAAHIFECIDGNTIDNSSLYDPLHPFENRDPRMGETIVEFGIPWLGFVYQPHPDSVKTVNTSNNSSVTNSDSRGVAIFASFTGMLWKKGIEQRWADNPRLADQNLIILRYADILLMHAESLIELNEDLTTAQNLINQVRARAYGVELDQTNLYPAVSQIDQNGLRIRLRRERRVEFMREGLRYQDIIRWRIGNKTIARVVLGLPQPSAQDRNQWPFNNQILPVVDQDGVVLFDSQQMISRNFASLLQTYRFDEQRMYLWPIPAADRFLNSNLTQNPGY